MLIMKFGGTSVATGERILHVARIVQMHRARHPVVVTSALAGVTDSLLALSDVAARDDEAACGHMLAELRQRHLDAARTINPAGDWQALHARLAALTIAVEQALARRDDSAAARDALAAFGELLAVPLVAGALRALGETALAWEAPIIVTDDRFGAASPLLEPTRAEAQRTLAYAGAACLAPASLAPGGGRMPSAPTNSVCSPSPRRGRGPGGEDPTLVTPGYIGRTRDGRITTLGRGGSDYSATLLAAALEAEACWIYTDVDGIFSADPRLVPDAAVLPRISAAAAGQLAYCGAKVLHPRAVAPAARAGIELRVRNSFRPEHPGTLIDALCAGSRVLPLAVAGRRGLCAVGVAGAGAAEVPALFGRLCAAVLAAQGEIVEAAHPVAGHDPRAIVDAAHAGAVVERLWQEFAAERAAGLIEDVTLQEDLALCVLLGAGLGHPQLVRAQRALATAHVAPISQSACPDVLSFIVHEADLDRAIVRLHAEVIRPALHSADERRDRPYIEGVS